MVTLICDLGHKKFSKNIDYKRRRTLLKNKKILVTGAGGFIGSHLVEKLVGMGCKVRCLIRYTSRNNWGCLEFVPKNIKND